MATKCPICGAEALEQRRGEFTFAPPPSVPDGDIILKDVEWEQCASCGEQLLPPKLQELLNVERYKRLGLLRPEDIKAVRERAGLTQKEMADFVGVGEKTYTRWESGRSIQNKSSDNLIRLADRSPELLVQLEAQRDPNREVVVLSYIEGLHELKGANRHAMAAHGGELDPSLSEALRERLRAMAKSKAGD